MRFWIEWALAVHRAVWFPLSWTLGLDRPGVELPTELAPHIAAGEADRDRIPKLRVVKVGRPTRAAGAS
jgi:hypothetical protein